jgi:hypothetical protein
VDMAGKLRYLTDSGRNKMDPLLCQAASMSHNEFKTSEPIEPQEARSLGGPRPKRAAVGMGKASSGPWRWSTAMGG